MRKFWSAEVGNHCLRKFLYIGISIVGKPFLFSLPHSFSLFTILLSSASICRQISHRSGHLRPCDRFLSLRLVLLFNSIPISSFESNLGRKNLRGKIGDFAPELSPLSVVIPANLSQKTYWSLKPSTKRTQRKWSHFHWFPNGDESKERNIRPLCAFGPDSGQSRLS